MNSIDSRNLKVFLCHGKEDKEIVRKLYKRLIKDGIEPLFDEEDLIAGQDWEREITNAVKRSDILLVCLSQTSVTKEGFIQKEIKQGLEVAKEKPSGTIFLIPLLLEACEIPDELTKLHWLRYYEVDSYSKLQKALQVRAAQLGVQLRPTNHVSLTIKTDNALEYLLRGNNFYDQKLYNDAEQQYKLAITLAPNNMTARNNLGLLYKNQGMLTEAEYEYVQSLKINPNDINVLHNLGKLYYDQKQYDKAEFEFMRAVDINPNNAIMHNNLANVYYKLEKHTEAEREYKRAIEINPNLADAYFDLGNAYLNHRRYKEAEQAFRKAIDINPLDAEAHNKLGEVYHDQHGYDHAERHYQLAIKLNPYLEFHYRTSLTASLLNDSVWQVWNWYVYSPSLIQAVFDPDQSDLKQT